MKKYLLIYLTTIFFSSCQKKKPTSPQDQTTEPRARPLTKYYGQLGADDNSAALTKDGCVVFALQSNTSPVTIVKVSSLNILIWKKEFSLSDFARIVSVVADPGGDLFFCGYGGSSYLSEAFLLIRTNSEGNILWKKIAGAGDVKKMIRTADGNLLLAGFCNHDIQTLESDVFLTKVTLDSTILWRKEHSNSYFNLFSCLMQTKDGGYVITCSYNRNWDDDHATYGYILKTDQAGEVVWQRNSAYPLFGASDCSLELSNGDLLFSSHMGGPYVVKTDSSGIYKTSKQFNTYFHHIDHDRIFTMKKDKKGNISMGGMEWGFGLGSSLMNTLFMKINENLDSLSSNGIKGTSGASCYGTNLVELPNGRSMVLGWWGDSTFVALR